ncbi:alpha/beta fold hydrolase [Bacillus sp. 31A1R]|uniref:Alpha/beta fold hydrolase n=1 Tax=Robertmurraya mangrovi TaxID=3098077 RepID=A0ABU5IYA3_9BACI|nr:alpha/beta fold hydrolase [Bacillus sp. 31A1R]MDZ5472096.1 alpha/beta fold hydrolase [Bacillus sp. 31A1R]
MEGNKEILRWKGFWSVFGGHEPPSATTPRKSIWKKNKTTLWYYPAKKKKFQTPLFLVYSLVNQPFILDLSPNISLIEAFVDEGYDVYLIDFGIPRYEDKDITLDNYIVGFIKKGVQKALTHSKAKDITVMGFCLGGTLAAIYTAIATEPIKNLILTVTPIDFSTVPAYDKWALALRNEKIDFDEFIDTIGLIPANFIEAGVRLVTAPVYFSHYLSLLNRGYEKHYVDKWILFNKWTSGHIPFPGATLKQLVNDLGKHNKLVTGELKINNQTVDLRNIKSNLLVVASDFDQLVPKEQTYPIVELASSEDKKYELLPSGHTGLTAKKGLPIYLKEWLPSRSNPI